MNSIVAKAFSHLESHHLGKVDRIKVLSQIKDLLGQTEQNPLEQECLQAMITELETPEEVAGLGMGIKDPLPPRFKCPPHHHIRPLADDKNGLVHGAIISGEKFDLHIKAFRWFSYEKIYYGDNSRGRWHALAEEVAGVCDLYDKLGKLVDSWSTAQYFKSKFANTSVPLPDLACQSKFTFVNGDIKGKYYPFNERVEGFYYSNYKQEEEGKKGYDPIMLTYQVDHHDSLMPDEEFLTFCRKHLYGADTPDIQKQWLVDPEYKIKPTSGNAFLINSSYLKVYESNASGELMVVLPLIWRKCNFKTAKRSYTTADSEALWQSKTYKL